MGKKFKKRFRGLCPCTKTSPTPEVDDGGNMDTGCKVDKKDKTPNPPTVKTRSPPLSKFDKMKHDIEAMYANITEKLDQRHKSLGVFAKFIFGNEYAHVPAIQGGVSVVPNQLNCDTPVTKEAQENVHNHIDSQHNGDLQYLGEKERKRNNKDKEKSKLPTFSDRILYQWMMKHLQASEDTAANVVEPEKKAAVGESITEENSSRDEIAAVVYVIDRVFIVDPRINHVTEVHKAGKPGDVYACPVHKISKSIDVLNADGAWTSRAIPARISDFTVSQEKYEVQKTGSVADRFVSPHNFDKTMSVDYHKVYGAVAERNKLLSPFLTSQRAEMHVDGQQMLISLAFRDHTQSHLQAAMFGENQFVQVAVPLDIFVPMLSANKQIETSSALSQLARTSLQDQMHIYKQVLQTISAFIHRSSVVSQAQLHGNKEVMQMSCAISQHDELDRPDHIPGYTQVMIISLDFGKQVLIGIRGQITGYKQLMNISIAFGQRASLDIPAQRPRIKDQMNISVTPFDHLAQICPRAQLPENRHFLPNLQALDSYSKIFRQTRISGYSKKVMQISVASAFPDKIDPGALISENTQRMQISKHVIHIAIALSKPAAIGIEPLRPGTKQQIKISTTFGKYASIGLRAQLQSTEHVKHKFQAVGCLAPTDLRVLKQDTLPLECDTPTTGQIVSSGPRAKKPRIGEYGKTCKTSIHLSMSRMTNRTPDKDGMGVISVTFDSPLLTRYRVKKPGNTALGRHSIALECSALRGLQKDIAEGSKQIHLAVNHIAAITERSHKLKTHQMRDIFLVAKGKMGHILLPFGQHFETSSRTRETGSDHKGQIALTFGSPAMFYQRAPKLGYIQPGLIFVGFGHLAFISQGDEHRISDPMTQISLASGNTPLILKIGKGHLGQIFLTFSNRLQITQQIQQVTKEKLMQIFVTLGRLTLASLFAQTSGVVHLGKGAPQDHNALTGFPARTTGTVPQICSAVGIVASTIKSVPSVISINVDSSLLATWFDLKRSVRRVQSAHMRNTSDYTSFRTRQLPIEILKEGIHIRLNVDMFRTSPAVEMLTRQSIFEKKVSMKAVEIAFQLSPAKDNASCSDMKIALPIHDIIGPSNQIGEFSILETTAMQTSDRPDIDFTRSSNTIGQYADYNVLEGKLTTTPQADTIGIFQVMTKPVNIKVLTGKQAIEEVHGTFGLWGLKNKPVGLKHVLLRMTDIQDLRMLRPSGNTVTLDSYFKRKPTAKLVPDRFGLCRAADLMARLDTKADNTSSVDEDTNKTPVVRSISISTTTDNKYHDKADHQEITRVIIPGNSKDRDTSHNERDIGEDKIAGAIPKTSSGRSRKEMQDKSTDTTGLPELSLTKPVVSKVPVPGSTFGRRVLKHEVMGNLQDLLDRGVPLDESHAKFLCINLLDILKYLLTRGVIHTNICPRNISFDEFGYPCLTGYDKSIFIGSDPCTRRKFRPSIEYCSPEMAMKTYITEATDVFSVGVLCFNVVYGRPPHQGRTYKETRDNIINNNFIPKFEPDGLLSKSGKFFLVSCIRKDIDKRFSVRTCGSSLVRSIKWFNDYDEKALLRHNLPSPFMHLLKD